jgi:superfamily II DNA or RNA helicase
LIVLHGGYLPARSSTSSGGFALWGEGPFVPRAARDRHARALDAADLEAALKAEGLGLGSGMAKGRALRLSLTAPAWHVRPVPSVPALREAGDYAATGAPSLRLFELDGLFLSPLEALDVLLYLPEALRARPLPVGAGDDLDYWAEVARWAFDLLLRRRVAPAVDDGRPCWRPVLSDPHEKDRFRRFVDAMPPSSRTLAALDGHPPRGDGLFPAAAPLLRAFLEDVSDAAARDFLREILPAERRRGGPGPESAAVAAFAGPPTHEVDPDVLARLRDWSLPLLEPLPEGDLRLGMRLVPPELDQSPPTFWLRYHLESTDDPTLQITADEIWSAPEPALRRLGRLFPHPQETLLTRLGQAAPLSAPLRRSLDERHPLGAKLSLEEAHQFLTREAPLLAEAGVSVLLPANGKLTRVKVRLHGTGHEDVGTSAVTRFGLQTLVDFDWRVALGDTLLTPVEFEELAAQKIPLVEVRGEWVLLDRESLARTLRIFDRRPGGRTTLGDFLRIAGGLEAESGSYPIDAVTGEGWLAELLDPEAARREIAAFQPPKTLTGTLRPYQSRGVGWLRFLTARGLGACLADDMGLGKTIQFLATLLAAREAGEPIRPSLLICPTSVAENWLKEAARFAPDLKVVIHHGPERASGEAFADLLQNVDFVVTTYALSHRDRALLQEVTWEYAALDEAQNVKNPSAAQSRAVRALKARRRAALTGTPVENRLSELKAIFDFLNPGLLGSDDSFRKNFSLPIERRRDPEAAERLRRITAPFLLRRAKTDPGVVPDLPEKIETTEVVGLTREQATLYRATTRSLLEGIGRASHKSRRAKVLTLLLRLKQICNHPALFLGDGSRLESRSGKLNRLLEMLDETLAEKSPSLLFTQFAEMGHLLVTSLKEHFGAEVLFLHGGVPRKSRTEMVRRFQEDDDPPPFFVLSLRAGGSGLNLTRASHVFHVDRWWNPAVEDQATDRAFRIGQTHNVQVHKFVCKGTLEERIDGMIDEKKDLARSIIGVGETWITELSDAQLAELVALSKDAVESEGGR